VRDRGRRKKRKPTSFAAHSVQLLGGFRTALPQVAAVFPHLPDEEARAVRRELALLTSTIETDMLRRADGQDPR